MAEDGACREALRKFQAWLVIEDGKTVSPSTAAYCKARAKLPLRDLIQTHARVVKKMRESSNWLWHGRRVMVVDGTGLSMPDTPSNQAAWPQAKRSKPGCGFPVMRVAAIFSLATGALAGLAHGALAVHERTLYRMLWRLLDEGDVLLGDRGFCGFADFTLLSLKGVDCVMRKNARRKNTRVIRKIGKNDRIVEWQKSGVCPKWMTLAAWRGLPESIAVREVQVCVQNSGFRTRTLLVATTLLDSVAYSASDIAGLYFRRWKVELFFRDIKTAMGMDILRCKTKEMVERELWMNVIAYNLIRAAMMQAALANGTPSCRISFKGTLSALRQWSKILAAPELTSNQRLSLLTAFFDCIARDKLPARPGRCEPRARKRRPKGYQLLNKPRGAFKEIAHRSRYKKPLS